MEVVVDADLYLASSQVEQQLVYPHQLVCSELGPHSVSHVVSLVPFLALVSVELEWDLFQELELLHNSPLEHLPSVIVVSSHPMRRLQLSC